MSQSRRLRSQPRPPASLQPRTTPETQQEVQGTTPPHSPKTRAANPSPRVWLGRHILTGTEVSVKNVEVGITWLENQCQEVLAGMGPMVTGPTAAF